MLACWSLFVTRSKVYIVVGYGDVSTRFMQVITKINAFRETLLNIIIMGIELLCITCILYHIL